MSVWLNEFRASATHLQGELHFVISYNHTSIPPYILKSSLFILPVHQQAYPYKYYKHRVVIKKKIG
jgi:hypothetical protein